MASHLFDNYPYRSLWAAVISQAVADMNSHRQTDSHYARTWVYSSKDAPGSFRWVCEMLDLDAGKLQTLCMTREGRKRLLTRNDGNRYGRKGAGRTVDDNA